MQQTVRSTQDSVMDRLREAVMDGCKDTVTQTEIFILRETKINPVV